jgi:hypothetical protein
VHEFEGVSSEFQVVAPGGLWSHAAGWLGSACRYLLGCAMGLLVRARAMLA